MLKRLIVALVACAVAAPGAASANHLGTGRPDCRTKQPAARPASTPAGDVSVHGYGGFAIDTTPFPAVSTITPSPRYDRGWDGEPILFEGDVAAALVSVNMIGVLGGGTTTLRPLGGAPVGAPTTSAGAQRFDALTFTGHFKIATRVYECESVVKANTIIRNLYYEIWLTGLLTPKPQSPLKSYGQATMVTVTAGDVSPR